MASIVIGAEGDRVANFPSSIDNLVKVDKSGNKSKIKFKPKNVPNPGKETMQFINDHLSDTDAFIIGLMEKTENTKVKIVEVDIAKKVEDVAEEYKKGKLYDEKKADNEDYNVPKEEKKEEEKVVDYSAPGSSVENKVNSSAGDDKSAVTDISGLAKKYSSAQTAEEREIVAGHLKQYLKEGKERNLKGKALENYVARRMEKSGYAKSNNSKDSSKKAKSKKS